jgi:hypothetical protein
VFCKHSVISGLGPETSNESRNGVLLKKNNMEAMFVDNTTLKSTLMGIHFPPFI